MEYYNELDALSFSDLLTMDKDDSELDPFLEASQPDHDHEDDAFEFLVDPEARSDIPDGGTPEAIVFCGKSLVPPSASPPPAPSMQPNNEFITSWQYPKTGLFIRREPAFKKSSCDVVSAKTATAYTSGCRSGTGNLPFYPRSICNSSRKRKVIIGLVMLQQPKMELNEMRKRQSRRGCHRRIPPPLFPVDDAGEPAVAGKGIRRRTGNSSSNHWGLLGPLRGRAHFVSAFTKACLPSHHA